MLGGLVLETRAHPDGIFVLTNLKDRDGSLIVQLEYTDTARSISEGDSLFWGRKYAYWSPRVSPDLSYPLLRVLDERGIAKTLISFPDA